MWSNAVGGRRMTSNTVTHRPFFLGGNVVIFNVKGNHYRLEVLVGYNTGIVVIRWAGTYAQYTKRTG